MRYILITHSPDRDFRKRKMACNHFYINIYSLHLLLYALRQVGACMYNALRNKQISSVLTVTLHVLGTTCHLKAVMNESCTAEYGELLL